MWNALRSPPQEAILFAFLRYTGLRVGEALALKQRQVDLEDGTIVVLDSKTANGIRTMYIYPELRVWIKRWNATSAPWAS